MKVNAYFFSWEGGEHGVDRRCEASESNPKLGFVLLVQFYFPSLSRHSFWRRCQKTVRGFSPKNSPAPIKTCTMKPTMYGILALDCEEEYDGVFLSIPFVTVLPAIYYRLIMTFVPFKSYWGIAMCELQWFIHTRLRVRLLKKRKVLLIFRRFFTRPESGFGLSQNPLASFVFQTSKLNADIDILDNR